MSDIAIEKTEAGETVVRIPAGRPFVLAAFEGAGMAGYSIHQSDGLMVGQLGAIAGYLSALQLDMYMRIFQMRHERASSGIVVPR